ncbi:MAG: hypothetical protein WCJ18_07790, partial [Planctomycetota bacterium]
MLPVEKVVHVLFPLAKRPFCPSAAHSRPHRAVEKAVYPQPANSAFAVYTAIATAFSSSLISFLEPCPL